MSSLGFVMLCHTALHRAAQVARHWAERDCPVVIHVDRQVTRVRYDAFRRELADLDNVRFSKRLRCEWGTWSLVQASQAAAELLLNEFPAVRHVYLASGSCLPLRPVDELRSYLAARPMTDFIESVTIRDVDWTVGGLNDERFKLRFPFSWKRRRFLFDAYVELQRKLGYRRRLPERRPSTSRPGTTRPRAFDSLVTGPVAGSTRRDFLPARFVHRDLPHGPGCRKGPDSPHPEAFGSYPLRGCRCRGAGSWVLPAACR